MAAPAWIDADWPAPPGVRGLTTLRGGAGVSRPPFDRLNLGLRCGDDPANALRNRALLSQWLALPSPPHWLQQVHGTGVLRVDAAPDPGHDHGPAAKPHRPAAVPGWFHQRRCEKRNRFPAPGSR